MGAICRRVFVSVAWVWLKEKEASKKYIGQLECESKGGNKKGNVDLMPFNEQC